MSDSKVVLVTGCAKVASATEYCKAFAEQKCKVFASDVSQRMADIDLDSLDNYDIDTLELDVCSDQSVESAVNTIISKCGRIDVVINNAGIGSTGPLAELPLETIRRAWEINTLGQLRLVQQVVPHMALRRSGSIVNIGSVVGKVPTPWAGSYCASKAYVHAMSNTLRVELKPFGIDVVLRELGPLKGVKQTEASVFAKHLAEKVLGPKPPRLISFGHMTGLLLCFLALLFGERSFLSTRFNLNKKL
ncbi:hypothetical protein M0R45_001489 [Rubus argutus]|uniref:Uncharacterized protein n=1 Tax=Rubus argutus TaxID=59490 RepID=A0AAW1VLH6_RUBAR